MIGQSAESSSDDPQHRRRGSRACQQCVPPGGIELTTRCRSAKARCHSFVDGKCQRCQSLQVDCDFVPSRRGRVKGSKNRATLRKLAPRTEENPQPSSPVDVASPTEFPVDEIATKIESAHEPFRFPLAYITEQNRRGWRSETRLSSKQLSLPWSNEPLSAREMELAAKWTSGRLGDMVVDQQRYVALGMHGVKLDVAPGLDAAQRGMLSERQVKELFQAFFEHANCQWGILDPELHTPSFVRTRSAHLFTAIMAIGATALSAMPNATPETIQMAKELHTHSEKLQVMVTTTGCRSVEIIQAGILKILWIHREPRLVDDPRWIRLGLLTHIATAVGLHHRSRNTDEMSAMWLNNIKTRMALLLLEARWASIRDGRCTSSVDLFDLTEAEWANVKGIDRDTPTAVLIARYELYRFERSSRHRLIHADEPDQALQCERTWIKTFLQGWRQRWSSRNAKQDWHIGCHRLSEHMWMLLRMGDPEGSREEVLEICIEILRDCAMAQSMLYIIQHPVFLVVAASLVCHFTQTGHPARDYILRVALLLAGDPTREEVMTFMKHCGYQMLNMICVTRDLGHPSEELPDLFNPMGSLPIDSHAPLGSAWSGVPEHSLLTQSPDISSLVDVIGNHLNGPGFVDPAEVQVGWQDWWATLAT